MKLFVWDFHGVLEKGNDPAVLEITNLALELHGFSRRMTQKENEFLSGRLWHEYFAFLLPEQEPQTYFQLQSTCFEISQHQPEIIHGNIQLNDHAKDVLEAIHATEHGQILISNTVPRSLDIFVKLVGIEKYFPSTHRFGVDSHNQNQISKKHCLQNFISDKNFYKTIISIGDSPGDMTMIEDLHVKSVGYLYTHPTKRHREAKCDYKIHDLRVVLEALV